MKLVPSNATFLSEYSPEKMEKVLGDNHEFIQFFKQSFGSQECEQMFKDAGFDVKIKSSIFFGWILERKDAESQPIKGWGILTESNLTEEMLEKSLNFELESSKRRYTTEIIDGKKVYTIEFPSPLKYKTAKEPEGIPVFTQVSVVVLEPGITLTAYSDGVREIFNAEKGASQKLIDVVRSDETSNPSVCLVIDGSEFSLNPEDHPIMSMLQNALLVNGFFEITGDNYDVISIKIAAQMKDLQSAEDLFAQVQESVGTLPVLLDSIRNDDNDPFSPLAKTIKQYLNGLNIALLKPNRVVVSIDFPVSIIKEIQQYQQAAERMMMQGPVEAEEVLVEEEKDVD